MAEPERATTRARGAVARGEDPLFEFGPEAEVVVGSDGTIERVNRRAAQLYGGAASDLVGESVELLVAATPGDADEDPVVWLRSLRDRGGTRQPVMLTGRHRDGSTYPAELSAAAVPASDELVIALRDGSARRRSIDRIAAMLDFAPDAIVVVDEQGTVRFANRQVTAVFGWPPHELVGREIEELVPAGDRAGHEALRRGFFASPRVRDMGAGQHLKGRRRDGSEFPVEISLSPLPGEPREVMAAIRDVTDRRAAERRARAMLEFAPDATIIVDRSGHIVEANRQVTALFGHDAETLVGMSVEQLLPERHRWSHVVHRDSFFGSPRVRAMGAGDELSGLRADGSEFAVEISLSPLPGPEPEVMATIRDVSDRRATSEALAAALAHERDAARELRHATRVKDEFLDVAAHELRTPLASISGFASALVTDWDEQDDAWKLGLLERIRRNARDMSELTNRLLDVSRLQAGRVRMEPVDLDVEALLRELVDDLEALSDREVAFDLGVDGLVRTDRAALAHVVTNLLTNAAKYSDPPEPIEVRARRDAGGVLVAVTDHGIGIPEEDMPHLFDHFYRGANQNRGRGAGVGLAVARQYVELLGGRLRAESTRGEGSTFTAWFPNAPSDGGVTPT